MFKIVKISFFLILVFVGLYFFGDFRLNDTNVKDFLQSHITMQKIRQTKQQINQIYKTFADLYNQLESTTKKVSSSKQKSYSNSLSKTPLDQLTKKDREQMINLLKNHLEKSK